MERNSGIFEHFMAVIDDVSPRLRWAAGTVTEHTAWRSEFRAKLAELVGRMPERVELEVQWEERVEADLYTRHKVYVRSEEHYWIPAYYFVPKGLSSSVPALVCLHGHGGVLPYNPRRATPSS